MLIKYGLLRGEMMHDDVLNIEEAFGDLKIPHSHTSLPYLIEKQMAALCTILTGDSWIGVTLWGRSKLK